MAQAARLNLRMQKELKLLLTDPPPGATFPSLSAAAEAAAPSLSSIEAQIEGPEGTVYAGGIFKLKIQIPDRYPFQPPNVTFATPIYHPNIDTGGRICLDILNLPPKGAWQPSLNISTVLTSIGLLLSEPNPDDGLMQEASQEFKYNRQVFDQKARSMTEKFARVGACEIAAVAGKDCQAPSLDCTEAKRSDTSVEEVHQDLGGNKRLCGISRKLSLESSEREKIVGKSVNEGPSEHFERGLGSKRLKQEPCKVITGQIQSHQVPQKMSKKLSLESSTSIHVIKDNDTTDLVSAKGKSTLRTGCSELLPSVKVGSDFEQNYNQCDERSKPKTASIKSEKEKLLQPVDSKIGNTDEREKLLSVSKKSSPQHHSSGTSRNLLPSDTESHNKSEPHSAAVIGDGNGNGLPKIKHKKLGLAGRHLSYGSFISRQCQEKAKTENQPPISTVPHVNSTKNLIPTSEKTVGHSSTSTCSDHRQPLKPLNQSSNRSAVNSQPEMESKVSAAQIDEKLEAKKQKTMAPPADMDKLIVLDSEDSDEDQRAAARSKLSLARRRLKGKLKSRTITLKEG